MSEQATRFPLAWPSGWVRTPRHRRQRSQFRSHGQRLTVAGAIGRLQGEIDRLGAKGALLSTNVETRIDGMPRSGQPEPEDPGAALYFTLKGAPRALACDKWAIVADNIAAIAQHIDALRRIDRYGVGTLEQAFAGYAALPPREDDAWKVLGVAREATRDQIVDAHADLAWRYHPDRGGSHEFMARINAARDEALKVLAQLEGSHA
jgi:hypothetical protein